MPRRASISTRTSLASIPHGVAPRTVANTMEKDAKATLHLALGSQELWRTVMTDPDRRPLDDAFRPTA